MKRASYLIAAVLFCAGMLWAQGWPGRHVFLPPPLKLFLGSGLSTDAVLEQSAANTAKLTGGLGITGDLDPQGGIAADSAGFKHRRVTTGSCGTTGCSVTVTWTTAFADANYTVTCLVQEATAQSETSGLRIAKIQAPVAASVAVELDNNAAGALTGTLHCAAIHD